MPKRIKDIPEEYEFRRRTLGQEIGARIRVCRKKLKLTQDQVRTRMELQQVVISRSQYSRFETGEILPNAAELIALHAVLSISVDWLLFGEG
jgi:transcriptional regulator with XRE-family HTH domain